MELYHVLNRGVDKRNIFSEETDYLRFVHNLFEFNNIQNSNTNNGYHFSKNTNIGRSYSEKRNNSREPRKLLVKIHIFCLMPNHYHLLISPIAEGGIPLFMKKLNMGYAKYFNEKYDRAGALFQGKYKSVHIENERHFLFIPFYIHFNPLDLKFPEWRRDTIRNKKKADEYLRLYRWSSHPDYLGEKNFPSVTDRSFFNNFFKEQFSGYNKAYRGTLSNFDWGEVGTQVLLD